jgi:multiple sugar transport system substrate-binding protein
MKKQIISSLAAAGLVLCPTVTAHVSRAASTTTITFMNFTSTPTNVKDLNTIIAGFEAANPTIRVNVITVAYAQYFTKLQAAVAGGNAPDTFELDYQDFLTYASQGTLLALNTVAPARDYAGVYYPRALGAFRSGGVQYGLPESFSDVLLFYNKDLFDKAHLSYPTAAWTWEDELAAAKKLTGNGVFGDYEPVQFFEFYKVLAQAGGHFFSKDGKSVAFNTPAGLTAIHWLVDKANVSHVMPTTAQMGGLSDGDMFKAGKLAMDRTGIWMFGDFATSTIHWDVVLEPGDVQKAHHFFANAVVIAAHSKNAAAAYKWLKYLTSSALAANTRIAASWELPAVTNPALVRRYLKETPPANRKAVFDALNTLVLPPTIAKQNQMQDAITNDLQKVQDGTLSAQAALTDMAAKVNALLH